MTRAALTPPTLAERWGTTEDKVLDLIRANELRAFNIAVKTGPGRRPRWRIPIEEVEAFERRRAASPVVKAVRRKVVADVEDYF